MIYLSENTIKKYNAGYMKASTVLKDYLPENNKVKEEMDTLFKKAKGIEDPAESTENKNIQEMQYYKLKHINIKRRKNLLTVSHSVKKGYVKIGIVTFSGNKYGMPMGSVYKLDNNIVVVPENEYKKYFGM